MYLQELFPKLTERTIPVSALNIAPRVFLNWKEEGIIDLPNNESVEVNVNRKTNRKWAYLNLFDALWLLIVKELRAFNIDLKTIRKLKHYLFDIEFLIDQLKTLTDVQLKDFYFNQFPEEMNNQINYGEININTLIELYKTIDDDYKIFCSKLSSLLYGVLVFKQSPSIQIFRLPQSDQLHFNILMQQMYVDENDPKNMFNDILTRFSTTFFINIPIKPLIELIFEEEVFEKHNCNYEFFNHKEQRILQLLRNDDFKEINIKKGNDGFLHLESKSQLEFKQEKAKEIRKVIGLKEYERIELIQRNDKHIIINKTNKEKL